MEDLKNPGPTTSFKMMAQWLRFCQFLCSGLLRIIICPVTVRDLVDRLSNILKQAYNLERLENVLYLCRHQSWDVSW